LLPIKGFQGTTLLDYPGKIASILFLGGCNFRCPYCQNPDLVIPSHLEALPDLPQAEILDALEDRRGFIDGVVVTGGEPALHPELPSLLRSAKCLGLAVKLDTNGYFPDLLEEVLKSGLVDLVSMDVKASPGRYHRVAGVPVDPSRIARSARLLMGDGVDYEFRTTCVPGLISLQDVEAIGAWLEGARAFRLQQFRPAVVLDPAYRRIEPFPAETLSSLAEALAPYVESVQVRGL